MKTLGLIGAGKWGRNYINTIANFENCKLLVAGKEDWKDLINKKCDGIIISTPPESHIEIAIEALEKNIPVIIEKPISLNYEDIELLNKYKSPIIVNHIHLFSDYYQFIKNNCDHNAITALYSCGYNNGPIRNYSSLYDYGPHDIALTLDIMRGRPQKFTAQKQQVSLNEEIAENFNVSLFFNIEKDNIKGELKADLGFGNGFPTKMRKFIVSSHKDTFIYDDLSENKLLFNGLPVIDKYEQTPLFNVIKVFLDAIDGKEDYRIGLDLTNDVMFIIHEIEQRLKE